LARLRVKLICIKEWWLQKPEGIDVSYENGVSVLYSVRQIPEKEAPSTLPLVQLKSPETTAVSWKDRVHELYEHGGGVVVVQCERGYFYGLLLYEPRNTLKHEHVLSITDLVALKLTGQENVRSLMLEWCDQRARELKCERIDIKLY